MANHTITIINRGQGSNNSSVEKRNSKTSSTNKFTNKKNQTKSNIAISGKTKALLKRLSPVGSAGISLAVATRIGVNTYATIASAATGDEMKYSNLQSLANAVTNPVGFAATVIKQSVLERMVVARQNESLNYQRQLTGDLVYSKKFNTGAF